MKPILSFSFCLLFFSSLLCSSLKKEINILYYSSCILLCILETNIMKCILYNHQNDAMELRFLLDTFVRIFFFKFFKLNRVHTLKRTYSPNGNHTLKARKTSEDQKEITVCSLQNDCKLQKIEKVQRQRLFQGHPSETFS